MRPHMLRVTSFLAALSGRTHPTPSRVTFLEGVCLFSLLFFIVSSTAAKGDAHNKDRGSRSRCLPRDS